MKPEFWIQGPRSWDSTCQVWPLAPTHQTEAGEGRERRFITSLRTCHGKRQSKHSAHPQPSDTGCRSEYTKELGAGDKVCINSPSHRCDPLGHYLSSCSGTGLLSRVGQVVHADEALLLGVVSASCHEDVILCLSWNPRWLQGDCKENGLEQRQIQNGGQMPCFSSGFN
jgi:hypothetical protein